MVTNKCDLSYRVDEAKFVSSCLSCPSSASPHLSLLLANSGVSVYTLFSVEPEPNGKPSLKTHLDETRSYFIACGLNALALRVCDRALVLRRRKQTDVCELAHRHLDLLDCLVRVVLDVHVDAQGFAVIVQLNKI